MRFFAAAALLCSLSLPLHATECDIAIPLGSINLNGLNHSHFLSALEKATAGGLRLSVSNHKLLFSFDRDKLPHNLQEAEKDARLFTQEIAPNAAANQARVYHYGLNLPRHVNPSQPLTILIHGLDSNCSDFADLSHLLESEGQQIACFVYPNDQPIEESAQLFLDHLTAVRETFPALPLNILAHSMGSLVARAVIEGPDYPGGVNHLILIAPPNHGTPFSTYRLALEFREHFELYRHEETWSPTWMITDGLGEAGSDLHPNSPFLRHLNALPRRPGVHYTIIAGNQSPLRAKAASAVDSLTHLLPSHTNNWLALGAARMAIHSAANSIRNHPSKTDGPVPVSSTHLEGVDDYVLLPADHNALLFSSDHSLPKAWPIIRDRLLH